LSTTAQWLDKDSAAGANQLLASIRQHEFILALFIAAISLEQLIISGAVKLVRQ